MLQEGGLEQLVAASAAMEPGLRCNGVWAMQNLAHTAQLPVKAAMLAALPWPAAFALLSDPEPDVQVCYVLQAQKSSGCFAGYLLGSVHSQNKYNYRARLCVH